MTSSPPGRRTVALRPISPSRAPETTVAQAAEPQASVRPTPALPDDGGQRVRAIDPGEGHVDLFGKHRMDFDPRAPGRRVDGGEVGDEERRVRDCPCWRSRPVRAPRADRPRPSPSSPAGCPRPRAPAGCRTSRAAAAPCRPGTTSGAEPLAGDDAGLRLDRQRRDPELAAQAGRRRSAFRCRRPRRGCRRCW